MAILIINNYYEPEKKKRAEQIAHALRNLGKTKLEIWSFSEIDKKEIQDNVEAIVLSGSTAHLQNPNHLVMYSAEIELVKQVEIPTLGICFGHQLIGKTFGSQIHALTKFIHGFKNIRILESNEIFSCWKRGTEIILTQSHRDYLTNLPNGFVHLAESKFCEIEAMKHERKPIYGVQAHIERVEKMHLDGWRVLRNFFSEVVKK